MREALCNIKTTLSKNTFRDLGWFQGNLHIISSSRFLTGRFPGHLQLCRGDMIGGQENLVNPHR